MSVGEMGPLARSYGEAAARTLERMAAVPGRPDAMAAFDRFMLGGRQAADPIEAGTPLVGLVCNFVPEELILALGAAPLRLDLGHGEAAEEGGRVLAAETCSVVRALAGAREGALPLHGELDLLVIPAACDGKKKLAQRLDGEVHVMDLPNRKDGPRASRRWYEEVGDLVTRLQKLTGRKLRRRPLRQAVELLNRRTALWRRLMKLRAARPGALGGRDAFLVAQASFTADPAWWCQRTEALLAELEAGDGGGEQVGVPLLLTGSPVLFPDFGLLELLEEAGAVVVADEMCSATQRLYNPTVLDEGSVGGMVRAVADKALLPCTCPCFVGGQDRINRVADLCRRSGARAVISHNLRLCQIYEMEQVSLGGALREHGLPVLALATDGDNAMGPLRTRVEAFLEMLTG